MNGSCSFKIFSIFELPIYTKTPNIMKNYYIFLFILMFYNESMSQIKCSESDSDVNYAYSHVKSAYDANNVSDLKYYSERSLDAFKRAQDKLNACGCDVAYSISIDGIELLEKVELADSYEDGRFYVKRAREKAKELIGELDHCNQITIEEEELLDLEMEQSKLLEKQEELERKQKEIRQKMVEQKQKEDHLQKEVLINKYESTISANIKTYNESLRVYGCATTMENADYSKEALFSLSDENIKLHYINTIKKMSELYWSKLDRCDAN